MARIRQSSEATSSQAKEGIGGEMFAFFGSNNRHGKPHQETLKRFQSEAYCRMDVYEKPTGRSAWLLGLVALRELLKRLLLHGPEVWGQAQRRQQVHRVRHTRRVSVRSTSTFFSRALLPAHQNS